MLLTWGTNIAFNLLYVAKKYIKGFAKYDRPIDFGKYFFDGRRILGESTTFLGLVFALLISLLALKSNLFEKMIALMVPLLVYIGHALGSFIKRRMNKNSFVPFIDHGDYMIMSGFVLVILGYVSFSLALVCLLLTYVLHPLAVLLAFKLGLKEHNY